MFSKTTEWDFRINHVLFYHLEIGNGGAEREKNLSKWAQPLKGRARAGARGQYHEVKRPLD